jgi:hypothetical protein
MTPWEPIVEVMPTLEVRRCLDYDRPTGRKVELVDTELKVLGRVVMVAVDLMISKHPAGVLKKPRLTTCTRHPLPRVRPCDRVQRCSRESSRLWVHDGQ